LDMYFDAMAIMSSQETANWCQVKRFDWFMCDFKVVNYGERVMTHVELFLVVRRSLAPLCHVAQQDGCKNIYFNNLDLLAVSDT
jgi:hypothetical protein